MQLWRTPLEVLLMPKKKEYEIKHRIKKTVLEQQGQLKHELIKLEKSLELGVCEACGIKFSTENNEKLTSKLEELKKEVIEFEELDEEKFQLQTKINNLEAINPEKNPNPPL